VPAGRFHLVHLDGPAPLGDLELAERSVVGRDRAQADIVLEDAGVSRRHAELTTHDGGAYIDDLGSKNGTTVNGERIHGRRALAVGDRVGIGSTLFELRATPTATQPVAVGGEPAWDETVLEREIPRALPTPGHLPPPPPGPPPPPLPPTPARGARVELRRQAAPATIRPSARRPGIALALSLLPGAGHAYVGASSTAVAVAGAWIIALFGVLLAPALGVLLAAVWIGSAVDARRRAVRDAAGQGGVDGRRAQARWPQWAGAGALVVIAALLILAEAVLPGLAGDRVRDDVGRDGEVRRVSVRAFPAFQLLWRSADEVTVELGRYRATTSRLADSLAGARRVDRLEVTADRVQIGRLPMRGARLVKDGDGLRGEATIRRSALSEVAPRGFGVKPFARDGRLGFEGSAGVGGRRLSARGRVVARDGRVLVEPDAPLGGLAAVTVFNADRVAVERVTARVGRGGLVVSARGQIR
jgi:hypothetical protein